MKFQELTILLPCHSLEDFPLHHEGEEAEGLLAAWTAMWHPTLLAMTGRLPGWARADSPPDVLEGRLLLVPQVSESLLLAGWAARVKSEGGHVIRKLNSRAEIVANALAELDDAATEVRPDRVADFFALGLAYLQVELLTRQMRYMSNIDEVHFQAETLRAAEAAVAGDEELTQKHLVSCFEVLTEARERFYPAEAYILDLTLVAPSTLGPALGKELKSRTPLNLLASGETIEQLAAQDPALLAELAAVLTDRKASLAGGEYQERETPILPLESILAELRQGIGRYERHLGQRPRIYGRRRFGLSPVLPQILTRLGFQGALHATLEDGQFPRGDQSKVRWEGVDTSAIDALTRLPLDASRAESFLSFPTKMGESMDLDHVATVVFAHWPGQACAWYEDLRRICSFAPVLGKFVTLDDYFAQTDHGGRMARFEPDQYRAPYLKQAIIRKQVNPLSRYVEHLRCLLASQQEQSLRTLVSLLKGTLQAEAVNWPASVEAAARSGDDFLSLDPQLAAAVKQAGGEFAAALPRGSEPANGQLVCNLLSFARKACVELPASAGLPEVNGPVLAAQQQGDKVMAVVEVPPMGFAWVKAGRTSAGAPESAASGGWLSNLLGSKKTANKPMAEERTLRNERMEVTIDPASGGIRTIHDFKTRGNRLSQQLGYRLPGVRPKAGDIWRDPDLEVSYASMVAEGMEVTSSGPALGEIVTHGRLNGPDGERLAGFRQKYQLWRGSPVLVIEIELEIDDEPRADPWNSYYAARFAWASEEADLYRGVGWGTHATEAKRLEAPLFVEARTQITRTSILTGGLPYHRRIGYRMLDTLLVVRGETRRKFRLGVGIDLAYSLPAALELLSPAVVIPDNGTPPHPAASSWLFHVDARNIVATHWSPLEQDGKLGGFRVRLLETEGRPGRALLRGFREVGSARQVDFLGQTLVDLPLESGGVRVDFAPHEWVEVEAMWK